MSSVTEPLEYSIDGVTGTERCSDCLGHGAIYPSLATCHECRGTGRVSWYAYPPVQPIKRFLGMNLNVVA